MSDIPRIHLDPEPATRDIGRPPLLPPSHEAKREDEHEAQRQAAFDSAFQWQGVPLQPFTVSRASLFYQLRLAMGAPTLDACLEDLDAFFTDACRILWLCSHTPKDWAVLRMTPSDLQAAMDEWADKNIAGHEDFAVTKLAHRIFVTARINQHEPAPSSGRPHGDDLGN